MDHFGHFGTMGGGDILWMLALWQNSMNLDDFSEILNRYAIVATITSALDSCLVAVFSYLSTHFYYCLISFLVRQHGRHGVPNIAIVVTDGKSARPANTRSEAALLKDDQVTVFAIGMMH